jgi:hypothetical protein
MASPVGHPSQFPAAVRRGEADGVILLTPGIALFEKFLVELETLHNDTHPVLVKMKREQEEELKKHFEVLEKYAEYERGIIEKQYRCEVQCARDELEDHHFSHRKTE